jgi:hypothetical protein
MDQMNANTEAGFQARPQNEQDSCEWHSSFENHCLKPSMKKDDAQWQNFYDPRKIFETENQYISIIECF